MNSCRPCEPKRRESLVIDSGQCSAEWLVRTLHWPWHGELIIRWDEKTRDVWPALVDEYNNQLTGQA